MSKRHEPHIRNKKPHDGFPFRHAAEMKIQGEQTRIRTIKSAHNAKAYRNNTETAGKAAFLASYAIPLSPQHFEHEKVSQTYFSMFDNSSDIRSRQARMSAGESVKSQSVRTRVSGTSILRPKRDSTILTHA